MAACQIRTRYLYTLQVLAALQSRAFETIHNEFHSLGNAGGGHTTALAVLDAVLEQPCLHSTWRGPRVNKFGNAVH
jgi:hypothetical protein